MSKKLSWKPIRNGPIYCSPACGAGCTRAEFDAAHKRGADLVKRLGRGWTVHVWENLGWHVRADSPGGSGAVYDHSRHVRPFYWADFSFAGKQFAAHAPTPIRATKRALDKARQSFASFARELRPIKAAKRR